MAIALQCIVAGFVVCLIKLTLVQYSWVTLSEKEIILCIADQYYFVNFMRKSQKENLCKRLLYGRMEHI